MGRGRFKVLTTHHYWDCECKKDYIHPKRMKFCSLCGAHSEDQPDSHTNEVKAYQFRMKSLHFLKAVVKKYLKEANGHFSVCGVIPDNEDLAQWVYGAIQEDQGGVGPRYEDILLVLGA